MKNFFNLLLHKFQKFMYGRYGSDALSRFILILAFVLMIGAYFLWYLYPFVIALLAWNLFRCFSKNTNARYKELCIYAKIKDKLLKRIRLYKNMWLNRKTVKYVKCKGCKTYIRLPRGKGKIQFTCPNCNSKFITKT